MRKLLLASILLSASQASLAQGVALRNFDTQERILGSYIVTFKNEGLRSLDGKSSVIENVGAIVKKKYRTVLNGYAISADDQAIEELMKNPSVETITADKTFHTFKTQSNAVFGLDRIDAARGTNGKYNFSKTGKGVHAYIIDTGLRASHSEFKGRVGQGFAAVDDGNGTNDCNGHGSHVAGTVGGTTFGVAKEVTIHPVRVLDCEGGGSLQDVLDGIEFVANNAIKPAVANMSLGGGIDATLDEAVKKAIAKGVTFVLAAGNESQNACNVSPANVSAAITVGAMQFGDSSPFFSNFGRCVDIFAPGVAITSVGISDDFATQTFDGTSMASPHVAGAVALLLETNPKATPAQIQTTIINQSTKNVLTDIGTNSPNRMLFTKP